MTLSFCTPKMAESADELPPLRVPREGLEYSFTTQFKTIRGDPDPEFTAQVVARFGQKYEDIVRKYGAVEYILNDNVKLLYFESIFTLTSAFRMKS